MIMPFLILKGMNKNRCITSIAFTDDGDIITGDSTGSIILWSLDRSTYMFRYNPSKELDNLDRVHEVKFLCSFN